MKVVVSQSDIDEADRTPENCAVARAMQRAFGIDTIVVGISRAWDDDNLSSETIELPQVAWDFICDFDNYQPVQPFSFEVGVK